MKERGRIVNTGMGGFLNPPGHPEHTLHVQTDLRRRVENRGGMCLSSAATCDWLDDATRAAAKKHLVAWDASKLALSDPEVQVWVSQVLVHFRSCYRNPEAAEGKQWNADAVLIDRSRDPLAHADEHCAVHHIRRYYPDFVLGVVHLERAYARAS